MDRSIDGGVVAVFEESGEIAVSEDTREHAGIVDDHHGAGPPRGQRLREHVPHRLIRPGRPALRQRPHRVVNPHQLSPQAAPGMPGCEVLMGKPPQAARHQRQAIAKRQQDRRARAGGQAEHACLADRAGSHHDRRRTSERAVGPAGECDDLHTCGCEVRQEPRDLLRLARLRQSEHDVVAPQHTEVAVHRLGRMEEVAGRACGGERGRDLLGDEPRLSDPRDDDLAAAARDHPHSAAERSIECAGHPQDGIPLGAENLAAVVEHVGVGGR